MPWDARRARRNEARYAPARRLNQNVLEPPSHGRYESLERQRTRGERHRVREIFACDVRRHLSRRRFQQHVCTHFTHHGERVVPAHGVAHIGGEVVADCIGRVQRASAAIAHVRAERRAKRHVARVGEQFVGRMREQFAMRRHAHREPRRLARTGCKRALDERVERNVGAGYDDLTRRIHVADVDTLLAHRRLAVPPGSRLRARSNRKWLQDRSPTGRRPPSIRRAGAPSSARREMRSRRS